MLVSLGIFTVVAVIAVGALVRIVSLNRQAQTLQSSMNNISFALEAMSREMRVGSDFHCEGDPNWTYDPSTELTPLPCNRGTGSLIAFHSTKTATAADGSKCRLVHVYRFLPVTAGYMMEKAQQQDCTDTLDPSSFSSILDDENVRLSTFTLGVYQGDLNHSWAFVRMAGYAGSREREKNYFDIQTSIAQRLPDND